MSYLREILNHTFLRAVYHTSSRQAKLEYEEVQRNFINNHANDDPNDEPVKFTALDIIDYISKLSAYALTRKLCKAFKMPSARW